MGSWKRLQETNRTPLESDGEEAAKKSLAGDSKSKHGSRRRKQQAIMETAVEDQPRKLRGNHSGGLTANRHRPDRGACL